MLISSLWNHESSIWNNKDYIKLRLKYFIVYFIHYMFTKNMSILIIAKKFARTFTMYLHLRINGYRNMTENWCPREHCGRKEKVETRFSSGHWWPCSTASATSDSALFICLQFTSQTLGFCVLGMDLHVLNEEHQQHACSRWCLDYIPLKQTKREDRLDDKKFFSYLNR